MRLILLLLLPLTALAQETSELAELMGVNDTDGFERALEVREFNFPEDHGPHPDFRNEWWYVTGNVDDADGRRFGYELTLFRVALAPESESMSSSWDSRQVYFAHAAITDPDGKRFKAAEKMSRGAAGLAGATDDADIWIENWRMRFADDEWRIEAATEDFAFEFSLSALKPIVLNGDRGLSQKSAEPGNASYYYSMTRLETAGQIRIDDREFSVSGLSWMDREWSTSALAPYQVGWDWFALQFDDNTEMMFYQLRQTDGVPDPLSSGTRVTADGSSRYLAREDVDIEITDYWDSPRGGRYPAGWILRVPEEDMEIRVTPIMDDQELSAIVRYWEGAVDIEGTRAGQPVSGRGYVEMTGYAEDN